MAKIMLVEDDNNLREIYGARLQAEGHEIVAAKDGEEALALAVKEKPDLIISDVMMPRISGFDMLDILRNAPETKTTKVIMMTALSQAEDKARADKLGADRYLVKSQVTLEDVANVVREVLDGTPEANSQTSADSTPGTPPATAETTTPAPSVESIANPVVEIQDEPDPSQVQAPPAEQPHFEANTHSNPASASSPVQPEPTPAPAPTPEPVAEPAAQSPSPAPTEGAPAPPVQAAPATSSTTDPDPLAVATAALSAAALTTNVSNPATSDDPVQTPTAQSPSPAPTESTPTEPIKVELPPIPTPPDEQATTDPVPSAPAEGSTPVPSNSEEVNNDSFVGPNLAEALASEEEGPSTVKKDLEDTTDKVDDMPAPVVSNGTPPTIVVEPTPAKSEEPEEPASKPTTDTGVSSRASASTAAGMRVIQPINEGGTAPPDINELLAAEERKAAVQNPTANTVITPGSIPADPVKDTPTQPAPPKPDDDNPVNNIAL